jgi:hypothetical protein
VDIHDNKFIATEPKLACAPGFASRMAVLANYGTYPDWSPYKGDVIQQAITRDQHVNWHDNTYVGRWSFVLGDVGTELAVAAWQGGTSGRDRGSSFTPAPTTPTC